MRTKELSIISFVLVVVLLASFCVCLSACNDDEGGNRFGTDTHIIDDNYRNYYEIFVWSFFDTDNDGIGDFNGVTQKLDYIKEMGYNGIWLMPTCDATSYHMYDVDNYYDVDSRYGTMQDLENLINEAHNREIKIIMDLVVNHSSENCNWFKEATKYIRENGNPGGAYGDYYNFTKNPEASGYSKVSGTDYYYEARFWSGMPDLNLDSVNVKSEIRDIMAFWLNKGFDGFRLDAVTSYYTGNDPKNIEFLSWLNTTAKEIKSDCYIVGECWIENDAKISQYYTSGIDSFFLFTSATARGSIYDVLKDLRANNGEAFSDLLMHLQDTYPEGCVLAPFLGNHDTARPGSFFPQSRKVKMAGGLMSMMNGSVFVYYGEEIGMISKDASSSDPHKRIAMLWDEGIYPGICYTTPEGIRIDESYYKYAPVNEQQEDHTSILNYYKHAMLIRNRFPQIARGTVEVFKDGYSKYVSVIRKTYNNESIVIVINLDGTNDLEFKLNLSSLGVTTLVDELLVDSGSMVRYDAKTDTVYMPSYSIAIFK